MSHLELIETDVPLEVKHKFIDDDMQTWRNTRWLAESRRRVAQRINDTENEAKQIEILQLCESALMELETQLRELPKD